MSVRTLGLSSSGLYCGVYSVVCRTGLYSVSCTPQGSALKGLPAAGQSSAPAVPAGLGQGGGEQGECVLTGEKTVGVEMARKTR